METKIPLSSASTPALASIPSRFIALLIDWLVLAIPGALIHFGFPFGGPLALSFLYFPIFHASALRATIGKKAMSIEVVMTSGAPLSLPVAFVRHLVEIASCCMACLGHVVAFFTDRKQALHDLVADTMVVQGTVREVSLWDAWLQTFRELFQLDGKSAAPAARTSDYDRKRRLDELERLHRMREQGVINEDEYQRLRKDLL